MICFGNDEEFSKMQILPYFADGKISIILFELIFAVADM